MAKNLYLIRLDGTYARYTGIVSDPVLTPLAADPLAPDPGAMQGMGEPYRDIPVCGTTLSEDSVSVQSNTGVTFTAPAFISSIPGPAGFSGTLGIVEPDDVAHVAPRQAVQTYTFWKFDFGVVAGSPQYAYAEFRRGDIIADTAPNTDPAV